MFFCSLIPHKEIKSKSENNDRRLTLQLNSLSFYYSDISFSFIIYCYLYKYVQLTICKYT